MGGKAGGQPAVWMGGKAGGSTQSARGQGNHPQHGRCSYRPGAAVAAAVAVVVAAAAAVAAAVVAAVAVVVAVIGGDDR